MTFGLDLLIVIHVFVCVCVKDVEGRKRTGVRQYCLLFHCCSLCYYHCCCVESYAFLLVLMFVTINKQNKIKKCICIFIGYDIM